MAYEYVPDTPLENMRVHSEQQLREWERYEASHTERLASAARMVAHWQRSLEEIETEQDRRSSHRKGSEPTA